MLNNILLVAMAILAFCFLVCLTRAFIGPRFTDRLVGINMTSSMGIGFVCILSVYLEASYIIDIAIVYTMLSFLTVTILSRVVILHHKGRLLHKRDASVEDIEDAK